MPRSRKRDPMVEMARLSKNGEISLAMFLALPSRPSRTVTQRPQSEQERRSSYGTEWMSQGHRRRASARRARKLRELETASVSSAATIDVDEIRKTHAQNRKHTFYLESSENQNVQSWYAEKQKKHQQEQRRLERARQKREELESSDKIEKMQRDADSRVLYDLWRQWKADPEGRLLRFEDYKAARSQAQVNVEEKEIPSYQNDTVLRKGEMTVQFADDHTEKSISIGPEELQDLSLEQKETLRTNDQLYDTGV